MVRMEFSAPSLAINYKNAETHNVNTDVLKEKRGGNSLDGRSKGGEKQWQ